MVDRPLRKKQSERRLDEPMDRGPGLRLQYDPERVGRFSERVARFLGTWRFIIWMTLFIAVWIALNVVIVLTRSPGSAPDPYPFIFLTLLLSLQASYAAPLILLAQNRQDDRDRVQWSEDRDRSERLLADTEYLVREVAALRMALGESATRDYVRGELRSVLDEIRELVAEETNTDETAE
ncbi:MAG: DUF1003 domain-containing protein [Actinomycetia bacterium]|nr:DUF1003 domain-containing protein [Actinomycetes bacterium]MCH9801321.1 DUF1003 domain-containing protein [Actinomycetes bacterium]